MLVGEPQHAQEGGVAQRRLAIAIDRVETLAGRIEHEPQPVGGPGRLGGDHVHVTLRRGKPGLIVGFLT